MEITYFDTEHITAAATKRGHKALAEYREAVAQVLHTADFTEPESALATWQDEETIDAAIAVATHFTKVKHVVLIGIGGSSLGVEAIHSVLANEKSPELHILDTVSAFEVGELLRKLKSVKKPEQIAVCIISKSGGTAETLTNAAVLLDALEEQLGTAIYERTICIGNKGNSLLKTGKKLGCHTVPMTEAIGGRYSVFTAVGLVPLLILKHDIDVILAGVEDATVGFHEETAVAGAIQLHEYLKRGYRSVNFFAFDTRLVRLGKWYRQLAAESLGKAKTISGKPVKYGFVPTISTAVELHSIGQLYFSGFKGVYTDFVSLGEPTHDALVSKKTKLAPKYKGKTMSEIAAAMYTGVTEAYQDRSLPYRSTVLNDDLLYALGLFMASRMLETMYLAKLLDVNPFDQPNVELYKDKMRAALKIA